MTSSEFRTYVPVPDHPRVKDLHKAEVSSYSKTVLDTPLLQDILKIWTGQLQEPFYGVTSDGTRREGLFPLEDEGAPVEQIVSVVLDEWLHNHLMWRKGGMRKWSNPELLIFENGIRLEALSREKQDAILDLVRASTSEKGYAKIVAAMTMNKFLGELVNARPILNQFSYQ
ncbi:hypothetical protein N7462_009826 [Penicillium macrosclerotiorum]|uniref:uncharacterized protein n=1 Tax=Penicillium macrosclerotiorum TaxID=303699 RepID=UPI002546D4EA|nr:uncharacterized protein N7462_009826 [Penicillium macrosclerotiorum]KAJ5668756.1 hypothetical protein N7462_009826 [Penicillium macrosclerotiorum]